MSLSLYQNVAECILLIILEVLWEWWLVFLRDLSAVALTVRRWWVGEWSCSVSSVVSKKSGPLLTHMTHIPLPSVFIRPQKSASWWFCLSVSGAARFTAAYALVLLGKWMFKRGFSHIIRLTASVYTHGMYQSFGSAFNQHPHADFQFTKTLYFVQFTHFLQHLLLQKRTLCINPLLSAAT